MRHIHRSGKEMQSLSVRRVSAGRGFGVFPPAGEHLYKNGTLLLQQADKLCAETVRLAD